MQTLRHNIIPAVCEIKLLVRHHIKDKATRLEFETAMKRIEQALIMFEARVRGTGLVDFSYKKSKCSKPPPETDADS